MIDTEDKAGFIAAAAVAIYAGQTIALPLPACSTPAIVKKDVAVQAVIDAGLLWDALVEAGHVTERS